MRKYTSTVRRSDLLREIEQLTSVRDDSGVYMMVKPCAGLPDYIMKNPAIKAAVWEIAHIRELRPLHVMINILPPFTQVPIHTDRLHATPSLGEDPHLERWHLPIMTNEGCHFWDEKYGEHFMPLGDWSGPVPYWLKHTVVNRGESDRVHLVVDLDSVHAVE